MPSYYDDRGSDAGGGGRWDTERFVREREERYMSGARGPPVRERERERDTERFERRMYEDDRYGPPARRPERRFEEDDDFIYKARGSGPLVEVSRHREEVSPPPRPRLIRRQSSLDTFDRQPARKLHRAPPPVVGIPVPPRVRRSPPVRERERDLYEEIRIAEPDLYGDEEFREFRERDRRRMRSPSRSSRTESVVKGKLVEEETVVEKPYPRKGKTRMPKRLVHVRALIDLGYPFIEEGDVLVVQKALSKELIDEVVSLSREMRRKSETIKVKKYEREVSPSSSSSSSTASEDIVERVVVDRSPRRRRETLVVERSPSRHRSRSRVRRTDVMETLAVPTVVRPRARSMVSSSPVRIIERDDDYDRGALVIRPKRSQRDLVDEIRALEAEKRVLQLERRPQNIGSVDIIKETDIVGSDGVRDEIVEVRKDRPAPDPRILRAMMASLT